MRIFLLLFLLLNFACKRDDIVDGLTAPLDQIENISEEEQIVVDTNRKEKICYSLECLRVERLPSTQSEYNYNYDGSDYRYFTPSYFIDLEDLGSDLELDTYFKLYEFMSFKKGRYGIFSSLVVDKLSELRSFIQLPIQVNSGYRSPGYNEEIGGVQHSRHTYGDAVDIYVAGIELEELAHLCEVFDASYTQVYESHVHCDWRDETKDDVFYDSIFKEQSHQHEIVSQKPIIDIKTEENRTVFSIKGLIKEDAGAIKIRWALTLKNGEIVTMPGSYLYIKDLSQFEKIECSIGRMDKLTITNF